jgi:hypothetical protein
MTPRTRTFLFGSSLVLAVGLCTGLVAYYNGGLPFRVKTVGPAEMAYLPADSAVVAYADVRAIMGSELAKKLRQILPTGEEKARMQAEIGVDLENDVDSVVVGLVGGEGPVERSAVALVRGRFNNALIESICVQHGATVEEYKGKRFISLTEGHPQMAESAGGLDPKAAHSTGALAFVEPMVLALGDSVAVRRAIDAAASGANVTNQGDLMKYVAELNNGSQAWVVGRFDAIAKMNVPAQVAAQLPPVQWLVASAHVDGGIDGYVRAETRDDESAKNLRDVVTGGLAVARLASGKDSRLDAMVNSVQVGGTGKTVSVSFAVPAEVLDIINGVAGLKNLTKPVEHNKPGK